MKRRGFLGMLLTAPAVPLITKAAPAVPKLEPAAVWMPPHSGRVEITVYGGGGGGGSGGYPNAGGGGAAGSNGLFMAEYKHRTIYQEIELDRGEDWKKQYQCDFTTPQKHEMDWERNRCLACRMTAIQITEIGRDECLGMDKS